MGFRVTGFDLDQQRVDRINAGESYIADVPSPALAALVAAGMLQAAAMPGEAEHSV
jgi:UDP-N-acetyl-D-glucosamine dehydrogenase